MSTEAPRVTGLPDLLNEIPLNFHVNGVNSVSLCHDGRLAVTGLGDKILKLWDTKTFTAIWDPHRGHSDFVLGVSCNANGL